MNDVIKTILKMLVTYKVHPDKLPLTYTFANVGIFYVLDNAQDEDGNTDYDLQIHLVHADKFKVLVEVDKIDKLLNNEILDGIRIIRKNVYLNHFEEEGKHTYILEYYARKFK